MTAFEMALAMAMAPLDHDFDEKECSHCGEFCCGCELCSCCARINPLASAKAILALPEMRALHDVLRHGGEEWMRAYEFPESLIAWMLTNPEEEQ
jgi:hypothetical protein